MSGPRTLPPPRILAAIVTTVVAVVVLVVNSFLGGGDGDEAREGPDASVTSSTTAAVAPTVAPEIVETSVVVAPDWYPKGTSRYSDRQPSVTITTLPSTSAPSTTIGSDGADGSVSGD